MSVLKRWNQLSRFLEIICYTGYVENGRPQSVILVAEPGEAKTELLNRFDTNPQLAFYSDFTYRTVLEELKKAKHGKRTHIVATELQKVIARKKAVSDSALTLMLQAMEEGVHRVGFGPQMMDLGGARLGGLFATTMTSITRNPFIIEDLAMDSRCFMIDATGSRAELLEIENRIANGDMSALKKIVIAVPEKAVHVALPVKLAQEIRGWVREMERRQIPTYGIRTYTKFLHTAKGVALKNGRKQVQPADVAELYGFKNLWLTPVGISDNEKKLT